MIPVLGALARLGIGRLGIGRAARFLGSRLLSGDNGVPVLQIRMETIAVRGGGIKGYMKMLEGLQNRGLRIARTMNRAMTTVRAEAARELAPDYALPINTIRR